MRRRSEARRKAPGSSDLLFLRDVLGFQIASHFSKQIDWWADLARSCLWWWPYRGTCVVSERPAEIHSPDGIRLHNETGPSVRFRDGWSIWAIDGVIVDEQVVLHPEDADRPADQA